MNFIIKSQTKLKMSTKNLDYNKMDLSLFLKGCRTREVFHTHISMGQYKSKYRLDRSQIDKFWSLYTPENGRNLGIAEKPQHYLPVIVDVDIKIRETDLKCRDEIHTKKHVKETIGVYQSVLNSIVENCSDKLLTCVLLEKPLYRQTKNNVTYVKHGFHLHFPYCFLNKVEQEIHLIPRVKEMLKELNTFKDIGFENSGDVIDDNCCKVPWLVYGSSKEVGADPYLVTKIYNKELKEIEIEDAFKNYIIYDMNEKPINIIGKVKEYLPQILSIISYGRETYELKYGLVSPLTTKIEKEVVKGETNKKQNNSNNNSNDILLAKELVKILNDSRADDRSDWLKVGWILFNVSEGSEEGFQIWNDFSMRCEEKHNRDVCLYQWSKMTLKNPDEGGVGMGTLNFYAKQDNKKLYLKIIREKNKDNVMNSLNGSHYDIAQIFQDIYGYDNVKITSQKTLACFIWNEKTKLWEEECKETLCKLVSDTVLPIYGKLGKELLDKIYKCKDKGEEALYNSKLKEVQKMMRNLKTAPYINNIIKALSGHSIDKDFETKIINRKTYELPIKDGKVINLKTLEVRERCFSDYWSFECNASYLGENANLDCVKKFFSDISCGSEKLIDYHRRLWGYLMTGEISDRSLHIFWGVGCNGKSSIINIFSNILGKFSTALSEDVMIKKTGRGASPELMPLLTARVGVLPESEKKEELNSKRIKTITGDDKINARHLFGHPIEFKTECKPIWATNHKPKINIDDQAILDRIKLIPFVARFEKNQQNTTYIKDLQENKLDEFFTWFCTGAYDWYNGEELIPCEEMSGAMDTYITENDVVSEFLDDTYELITNEEYAAIPKLEKTKYVQNRTYAHMEFIAWINDNNRKDDSLGKKEFYAQFDKKVIYVRTTKIKRGFLGKKKDTEELTREEGEEEEDWRPPM